MKLRVSIGLAVALAVAAESSGAAAGDCVRTQQHKCPPPSQVVDFSLVPDVGKSIALEAPAPAPATTVPPAAPETAPYTGPMIDYNRNERAPTIGYHWSLD